MWGITPHSGGRHTIPLSVITCNKRQFSVRPGWHVYWNKKFMKALLLCSQDPLFLKSLYCVLKEEGYEIEVATHTANAVRLSLFRCYSAVIMDSGNVGFSEREAAKVITSVTGGTPVIIAGGGDSRSDLICVDKPLDLEEVRGVLRNLCGLPDYRERRVQGL
jgi:DNA-binding NtrC family response regulator